MPFVKVTAPGKEAAQREGEDSRAHTRPLESSGRHVKNRIWKRFLIVKTGSGRTSCPGCCLTAGGSFAREAGEEV